MGRTGAGSEPSFLSQPVTRRRPRLESHFLALTDVAFDGEPSGAAPVVHGPGAWRVHERVQSQGAEGRSESTQKEATCIHPNQAPRGGHFRRGHFLLPYRRSRRASDVRGPPGRKWLFLAFSSLRGGAWVGRNAERPKGLLCSCCLWGPCGAVAAFRCRRVC